MKNKWIQNYMAFLVVVILGISIYLFYSIYNIYPSSNNDWLNGWCDDKTVSPNEYDFYKIIIDKTPKEQITNAEIEFMKQVYSTEYKFYMENCLR